MAGMSPAVRYRRIARELQKVPARLSTDGAAAIQRMWRKTYRAGQDPYGKPLAKLAKSTIDRKGHDKILIESGDSYDDTRARAMAGSGIQLVLGEKLQWHLEPTENRPARIMLPLNGLPAPWRERLRKIAVEHARRAVRG
jgi:hypothetical protein